MKEIPVRTRDLTDQQVRVLQFVENYVRKNLAHSEKAKGVQAIYGDLKKPDGQPYSREELVMCLEHIQSQQYGKKKLIKDTDLNKRNTRSKNS
jgi:hypothetical protein